MGFRLNRRAVRVARLLGLGAACLALANCTTDNVASRANHKHGASSRMLATGETIPAPATTAATSVVRKHVLVGTHERAREGSVKYSAVGVASWYGEDFHGRPTANGETFNMNSLSAAHPSLPLPCNVRVTNLVNHRSIVVRVNDRGPYVSGRVIDVSAKTAKVLGFYDDGLSKVKVEYVGRAQ
ncbi:MAG TPA: septal ring lytic transglycosylase RlpA family protein [Pseudolabrys sp.]